MEWEKSQDFAVFFILFPRLQGGSKKAKILGKKTRSGNTGVSTASITGSLAGVCLNYEGLR